METSVLVMDILAFSIIGSILVLLIILIKAIFKEKLNCYMHYYIWLLLIIKLIFPIGIKSNISIYNISNLIINNTAVENMRVTDGIASNSKVIDKSAVNKVNSVYTYKSVKSNGIDKFDILFGVWSAGALFSLFLFFYSSVKIRYIINHKEEDADSKFNKILDECRGIIGINKNIKLICTDKIDGPSIYGLFNPVIFIPVNIEKNITKEQFKYIVLHELSHFKRKDMIINIIASLLKSIYWFNPIILYGFYKMRQDCEIACDAQAISYLKNDEKISYGETVIALSQKLLRIQWLPGTNSFAINKFEIKRRIIMISKYKKITKKSIAFGIILIAAIGIVALSSSMACSQNNAASKVNNNKDKTVAIVSSQTVLQPQQIVQQPTAEVKEPDPFDTAKKYLADNGYTILPNSVALWMVKLPDSFDESIKGIKVGHLLKDRNELSKKLGFDFSSYLGKEVTLFTCAVGPDTSDNEVICFLYAYKIIGFWIAPPPQNGDTSQTDWMILKSALLN